MYFFHHSEYSFSIKACYALLTSTSLSASENRDVTEHAKLSNITLRHKYKLLFIEVFITKQDSERSCLQLQLCGTTFRTISELKTVSTTLNV